MLPLIFIAQRRVSNCDTRNKKFYRSDYCSKKEPDELNLMERCTINLNVEMQHEFRN